MTHSRLILAAGLALCLTGQAGADPYDDLVAAMRLDEVVALMSNEGIEQAHEMRTDLALSVSSSRWQAIVVQIYDPDRMMDEMRVEFDKALTPEQAASLAEFYNSPAGQRITEAEISTREIFGAPKVEEAAIAAAYDMDPESTLRREVAAYIDVNDLVALNVMGTLNDQLAFNRALADSGALGPDYDMDQLVADMWSDVDALNLETENWLTGYLVMAYGQLEDGDLSAYVDLSADPMGQALNKALFDGFDATFIRISQELGLFAGSMLLGQEL